MRTTTLTVPKVASIAVTRGMLGFGAGLLAAPRLEPGKRRVLGLTLLSLGLLSTIPLAAMVLAGSRSES